MVKKIDTIKRLRLFGDFLMLGSFLLLLWLFISAYLNNNFSTTVHVNQYGEAHVEMIVLVFFLLPLFILTTSLSFLDWRQTWKAKSMVASQKYILSEIPLNYPETFEEIVCPRCKNHFITRTSTYGGIVSCPSCGLEGKYIPDNGETEDPGGNKPEVRIIKDIRH
jgi:predicted RNA-binding Zn-ribbon protein involved in translation (DUF1610 family)